MRWSCFPLILAFSSPSNHVGNMKLITVVLNSPNAYAKTHKHFQEMWNDISIFLQNRRTYISIQYMEWIRVYSKRMISRGVYERQLTQNGHKATTNMIYTDKNWSKLYTKYTKSCYFNKTRLIVHENKNCNVLVI